MTDKTVTLTLEHAKLLQAAASLAYSRLGPHNPDLTRPMLFEVLDALRSQITASVAGWQTCYPFHSWHDPYGPGGALCVCEGMVFAVRAGDIRPSTAEERADPTSVHVIREPCDESTLPSSDPRHLCDVCDPPQEWWGLGLREC